jgi:isopenicillin N synthase-like dioxygenase
VEVKVCNIRDNDFNTKFIGSVLNTGFAVVTHHGIDFDLIKDVQDVWRHFFNQPPAIKERFANPNDPNMGYIGFGKEKAVGATKADLKEWYHWRPGNNLIPSDAAALTQKLYYLLEAHLAPQLLQALNGLGSDMNYKEVCQGSNNTLMRSLYYPALNTLDYEKGAVRSSAHQDINFLTLLVAASAPGLQVLDKNEKWHAVPFEENCIVVNVGDSLQLASGGMLKSTTHRVTNPANSSSDRISIPLFVHPHGDTILAPGVTAQQFLDQRLNEIYVRGKAK